MVTNEGYIIKSEEEFFNELKADLKSYFPNMSESPANLMMVFARILSRNENRRDYEASRAVNNMYVSTAVGSSLDKAVRTAGINRSIGTHSTGKVKIKKTSAVAQIVIPANTVIDSSGLQYKTLNKNAIIISSTAEVEFEISSIEVGINFNISIGSKFKPVFNIYGVESIIASTDISGGKDRESDVELRARYFERMSSFANSSLGGIIGAVERVEGVTLVSGIENKTNSTDVDGLIPHSFKIFAEGGSEENIANAIANIAPAGIQSNGDITKQINLEGKNYDIKFSRFVGVNVYFNLEVLINPQASQSDIINRIKSEIAEYIKYNSSIIGYVLSSHLSKKIPDIDGIKKLNFGLSPNPTTSDDLIPEAGKKFSASLYNVVVKVV